MMIKKLGIFFTIVLIATSVTGCRGWRTDKPPVHPNPNLDWQANIKPQESPQTPPENTVIWGRETSFNTPSNRKDFLKENTVFYKGKTRNGNYVRNIPVSVDTTLLSKGEERYNIYCAACHTKTGNGLKSQITEKGWVIPNIREYPTTNKTDGELFTIVRHGIRSMPGYRKSLSEYESWAIVSHIRVLQKNNASALSELSENTKRKLR